MKSVCFVVFVLALAVPAAHAQMGQGAPQTITLAAGMLRSYEGVKRNLTEMAEKMPEADYGFQITKDVRTFGQLFGHVANSQFNACSAARGVANPNQGNDNEKKTTKAEFVKALADSFAFCDEAFKMLTDANATEMMKQGRNSVARGSILAGVIGHDNEMYGTAIPYYRSKGLTPPSTERMQQMMRKPGAN
ncbi:MAG TPA: DinB family protein [Vicinamibacterales bacterium]|nr:DinB family protein [Vicinamibacterales bacterium]